MRNSYALTPTALAAIDAFHTQAFGIGLLATDRSMRRSRVQVGCVTHVLTRGRLAVSHRVRDCTGRIGTLT